MIDVYQQRPSEKTLGKVFDKGAGFCRRVGKDANLNKASSSQLRAAGGLKAFDLLTA